jgi:hypothetical protein
VRLNQSSVLQRAVEDTTSSVAVFVCSSDSRRDILERVVPSIVKFWPSCPYKIYVGLNTAFEISPGFIPLLAPPSDWRKECLDQVNQISESNLIVILDDFLIEEPVDQNRLSIYVTNAVAAKFQYLRLLPLGKSLIKRIARAFHADPEDDVQLVKVTRPFYSSLQVALWDRLHFVSMLKMEGSIWDFEHQGRPDARHHAITQRPPIMYRHLVEKGRWLPYAKSKLQNAGLSTDLGIRPTWRKWRNIKLFLDEVRFYLLGYAIH